MNNSSSLRFNTSMWPQKLSTETRPSGDRFSANYALLCRRTTSRGGIKKHSLLKIPEKTLRPVCRGPVFGRKVFDPKAPSVLRAVLKGRFSVQNATCDLGLLLEKHMKGPKTQGPCARSCGGIWKTVGGRNFSKVFPEVYHWTFCNSFLKKGEFGVHTGHL